eukprot:GHRQ01029888.1.p2 GENE.GHRQ01029888.1~~GHRQ01029888.1.p2  ORF type:complete len:121 (-),score=21.86 GHRQ01029888.1:444-806(-)
MSLPIFLQHLQAVIMVLKCVLPHAAADVMKFNGPAPELVNGRLAMIGILAAAKQEIEAGSTVLQQALQASPWLYAVLGVWVYASLVPIFKGVRHEAFGEWQLAGHDRCACAACSSELQPT